MAKMSGVVFCGAIDGRGGIGDVGPDMDQAWRTSAETVWIHLDTSDPTTRGWLDEESGLSQLTVEMLLSDDTRPRVTIADKGLVICLRAVNCNPGADPDDMVSLRLWITGKRILTMRRRRVEAVNDIREALNDGDGPTDSATFLDVLCERVTFRIAEITGEIDDGVDGLEDEVLERERRELRAEVQKYRRMIIGLRRYLIPQRESLLRLVTDRVGWIGEISQLRLRESAERIARCVDDLDAVRDRAAVIQEELNARLSEATNRTIYTMSIVATIFLPLGLLTGLLGINVGGIPGVESRWAFAIVCGVLVFLAGLVFVLFKRRQII